MKQDWWIQQPTVVEIFHENCGSLQLGLQILKRGMLRSRLKLKIALLDSLILGCLMSVNLSLSFSSFARTAQEGSSTEIRINLKCLYISCHRKQPGNPE